MTDTTRDLTNVADVPEGKRLTRRRLMGTSVATLGAAVLAGGTVASVAAGPGHRGDRVVQAQDGGKEFHSSWPYLDLGSGGHFNSFVTDAILPGNNIYGDMIRSPLGLYYWEADEWLPLLATEWRFIEGEATPVATGGDATPVAGGSAIFEVKLREDAVWSDGAPFTATDVVDTLWCYRIMSNSLWSYVDDAVAIDDYTVHCSMSKPSTVVERYVIRQAPPVPSSVYGEWAQRARDVFGAGLTTDDPEGAQLLDEFNQFRPELPPASGPYQIDEASITNAQMTLVKNETSVFADMTPFDRIINFNGETDTISAVALSGEIDYATQAFAPATEQELINNGIRIVRPPVYSGPALLMNYDALGDVFGDKLVRQALAHAIDGDQIGFFALADSGVPVIYNVGFSDNIIGNWLSQEAIDGLNQYQTDLELAAQLLTEAGWSKEGDIWKTQTGEDASFELIFPAEFADWSAAGQALASQLTDFGIVIEPRAVTFTQQPIDVDQGNFQLAIRAWGAGSSPHPHFSYTTAFFVHNTLAINNGGTGIGFPLEQTTDVAGEVDLNELVVNSALGLDVEAQKADVTVMAQVYNELLPVIPLFERYGNNVALEGVRVQEWPPEGDPILKQSGADGIPTMMMYLGRLEAV